MVNELSKFHNYLKRNMILLLNVMSRKELLLPLHVWFLQLSTEEVMESNQSLQDRYTCIFSWNTEDTGYQASKNSFTKVRIAFSWWTFSFLIHLLNLYNQMSCLLKTAYISTMVYESPLLYFTLVSNIFIIIFISHPCYNYSLPQ